MEPISLDEVREEHRDTDDRYLEFLRRDSMSVGRYVVPAGGTDPQTPHDEDEVYVVTAGRASIRIGDDEYPVERGDVVLVERHVDHQFFDVREALETLVVFAPAEGTLGGGR